jgi:hypothetical protein
VCGMGDYLTLAVASRTTPLRDDQTGCVAAVGGGERREGLLTSLQMNLTLGCSRLSLKVTSGLAHTFKLFSCS